MFCIFQGNQEGARDGEGRHRHHRGEVHGQARGPNRATGRQDRHRRRDQ